MQYKINKHILYCGSISHTTIMLDRFQEFIQKNEQINEENITYYLRWISDGYAYINKDIEQRLSLEQKQQFLSHLARHHEERQVKQADYALTLYDHYLSQQKESLQNNKEFDSKWEALEDSTRNMLRLRHRSFNTEKSYAGWLRQFRRFVGGKNPQKLAGKELMDFLTYLSVEKRASLSTQSQAMNAILFVYRYALNINVEGVLDSVKTKQKRRPPNVLTTQEIEQIFEKMSGTYRLMAMLTYGCGLRITECLNLRIKDIDFEQGIVIVRAGRGGKDRSTVLPARLKEDLIQHIAAVRLLYEKDRQHNLDGVYLPGAHDNKKYPNAGKEWGWFWLFPSQSLSVDPRTLIVRRHHLHPSSLQRAVRSAVQRAGISKQVSVHTLRHSFATHLLENGYNIRAVQELLGHSNLQTTMIYTRVASKNIRGIRSPLDK